MLLVSRLRGSASHMRLLYVYVVIVVVVLIEPASARAW